MAIHIPPWALQKLQQEEAAATAAPATPPARPRMRLNLQKPAKWGALSQVPALFEALLGAQERGHATHVQLLVPEALAHGRPSLLGLSSF